jgi:amino acid permease
MCPHRTHLPCRYADELAATSSWRTKGLWLAVTLVCIAFGGCVAWALPYFSIVMAVIAALGDVMSMFGLPCLFALRLLPLRRPERWLCRALLMLACALSAAGVFSSVQQLIAQAVQ